jgi:hypothetical protein
MSAVIEKTACLLTLTLADVVKNRGITVAILGHPAAAPSKVFYWQSESRSDEYNDETTAAIRDWGRKRLAEYPVLDLDNGKTASTTDFEWDSLLERGSFSAWSKLSAVAFEMPTLAESLANQREADEIIGWAIHCPWEGQDAGAWYMLHDDFYAAVQG